MATKNRKSKPNITSQLPKSNSNEKNARFKEEDKDSLAYKVLSADQTKLLLELGDLDAVHKKLEEILELHESGLDLKQASMLDYYVSGFWWAVQQGFSSDQASAMFTVLHQMLENVKDRQLPVVECLKEFKKLFAGIGLENAELSGGLECFDMKQAKRIMNYFDISLFQHYKMYEFVFGHMQAEEIIGTDLVVEVAPPADIPWPAPLEEAVTEHVYNAYIATPPPTPPAEEEGVREKTAEEIEEENEHVADLLTQLTPTEVTRIMTETFNEMLSGLKTDVQAKLRQKENDYIMRINKISRTPSETSNAASIKNPKLSTVVS